MYINNLNPVAFEIFGFEIWWYSLAYIFGLLISIQYGKFLTKKNNYFKFGAQYLDDYLPYAIFGIIVGGRLGYVLFYDLIYFINNPLDIFLIWQGGMSFHGGLIGIISVSLFFIKKNKIELFEFTDLLSLISPIGLFLGRLANFINSELIGHPTEVPWGVIFEKIDNVPRHPSQIYEALLEGVILFVFLNVLFKIKKKPGLISGSFLIFYAIFRIIAEQFRLPDEHIGYLLNVISMGSLLSLFMFMAGLLILYNVKDIKKN